MVHVENLKTAATLLLHESEHLLLIVRHVANLLPGTDQRLVIQLVVNVLQCELVLDKFTSII